MLSSRFLTNCIIVSACMLLLGSASRNPAQKRNRAVLAHTEKQAIMTYNCSRCGETIGPNNLPELFSCLCSYPSHGKHAFHRKCVAEWFAQRRAEKTEEACPVCMSDWKEMYKKSRREVLKESILQSTGEEKELGKLRRRASGAALGKSEQIDLEATDHFKMLKEAYNQLISIYFLFPHDFISPKDSEMQEIFGEIGAEMLRKMPIEEAAQALINAPKFIYTDDVLGFVHDPMLYAQLDYRQVVDFGRHLLILAAGDGKFESFFASIVEEYIYHNLSTLDSSAVECLINLTVSLDLEEAPYWLLLALKNNNISLSLKCRAKLMMPILRSQKTGSVEKLSVLQFIGYFTEFTDEMRQGAIDCWAQSVKEQKDIDRLFLNILSFRAAKPEEEPRTEILRDLKGIIAKKQYGCSKEEMLEFRCCHHMVCSSSNGSFLHKLYKLIMHVEDDSKLSRIISSVPSADFKVRRSLILISGMLKNELYISETLVKAILLHPGVTFKVALRSLFDSALIAERRSIYALQIIAYFKVSFRRDLQAGVNARLLFGKLKNNGLYALMPLFREYFSEIPLYEECVSRNTGDVIKTIPHIASYRSIRKILCALCDTGSNKINKALCSHFSGF